MAMRSLQSNLYSIRAKPYQRIRGPRPYYSIAHLFNVVRLPGFENTVYKSLTN